MAAAPRFKVALLSFEDEREHPILESIEHVKPRDDLDNVIADIKMTGVVPLAPGDKFKIAVQLSSTPPLEEGHGYLVSYISTRQLDPFIDIV